MNRNLVISGIGALVAALTLAAGFIPAGPWQDAANAVAAAIDKGPIHDFLLLLAGGAITAGFGAASKDRTVGEVVTGKKPNGTP